MKFKEGFRIFSRINIIVGVMRELFLEKRARGVTEEIYKGENKVIQLSFV